MLDYSFIHELLNKQVVVFLKKEIKTFSTKEEQWRTQQRGIADIADFFMKYYASRVERICNLHSKTTDQIKFYCRTSQMPFQVNKILEVNEDPTHLNSGPKVCLLD